MTPHLPISSSGLQTLTQETPTAVAMQVTTSVDPNAGGVSVSEASRAAMQSPLSRPLRTNKCVHQIGRRPVIDSLSESMRRQEPGLRLEQHGPRTQLRHTMHWIIAANEGPFQVMGRRPPIASSEDPLGLLPGSGPIDADQSRTGVCAVKIPGVIKAPTELPNTTVVSGDVPTSDGRERSRRRIHRPIG